jgi:eukaryotic-like serine/threonine-protein kinase
MRTDRRSALRPRSPRTQYASSRFRQICGYAAESRAATVRKRLSRVPVCHSISREGERPNFRFVIVPEVVLSKPRLMSPQQSIAHYRIVSKLGEGGMGVVWRATDTKLNREVAIKVLPAAFAASADRLARFTREAQVLASLNHPNIAAIYGAEDRALVMELVPGPTLAERIAQRPLPIEEAIQIARQIAEALEFAHEHGIIHRDLKPANVKVTPEGRVKVLDFGLAKAISVDVADADPVQSPTVTMGTAAGVILGTPAYMAPEQAIGKPVDKRADIWAFGVVFFEMLTGRSLYPRQSTVETLAAVTRDDPPWRDLPAEAPLAVVQLLRRCLDKDPLRRLRDIGEARFMLAGGGFEAVSVAEAHSRQSRIGWIAAAGFAATAVVFAALLLWGGGNQPGDLRAVRLQIPSPTSQGFAPADMAAVSPDGTRIVFSNAGKLFVRALDSTNALELPESSNGRFPFWSADGRAIAFFAQTKLKQVNLVGGAVTTLAEVANNALGGAWGRDGSILYNAGPQAGLMRIQSPGGGPLPVTELDAAKSEGQHGWPCFLPDGRHFLFSVMVRDTSGLRRVDRVAVGSLDSKQTVALLPGVANAVYTEPGYVVFGRGGRLLARRFDAAKLKFTSDEMLLADSLLENPEGRFSVAGGTLVYRTAVQPRQQLRFFDRRGNALSDVGPPGRFPQLMMSPDGTLAAAAMLTGEFFDIWVFDTVRGTNSRLTFGDGDHLYPRWSPDGRDLLYTLNRKGKNWSAYRLPVGGGGKPELVAEVEGVDVGTSWWTSKYYVLGATGAEKRLDIWLKPVQAGEKMFPILSRGFDTREARVSPDEKWIAYAGPESGRAEIYVETFPPQRRRWQISTRGGEAPRWRSDGRELFYREAGHRVMAVDVSTSGGEFHAGIPKMLFEAAGTNRHWDGTPDGQKFLLIVNEPETGPPPPLQVTVNCWSARAR